jgi:hypothetical protein
MLKKSTMLLVWVVLIFGTLASGTVTAEETGKNVIILPAGTPLKVTMQEALYSQRNREGDEILFSLEEDIVVMGEIYLVKGTPILGRVTNNKPSRSWGRGGNLDIEITSVYPLYSMPIKLSGESGNSGGSKTVESVATTVIMSVSVVGLLLGGNVDGKSAIIEAGTNISVFSVEDAEIMNISAEEKRKMVEDWYTKKVISSFLNYSWDKNPTIGEAMKRMGFNVDESAISVEPMEDYRYSVTVKLDSGQNAIFTLKPWEEPHIGKFKTIQGENELANDIINKAN